MDTFAPESSYEFETVSVSSNLISITITSYDPVTGTPEGSPFAYMDFNVNNLSNISSIADFTTALQDMLVTGDQSIEFNIGMPASFEGLFEMVDALSVATNFSEFNNLTASKQAEIIAVLEDSSLTGMRIVDDSTTVMELTIDSSQIVLTVGDYTLTITGDDLPFGTYWKMVQAMQDFETETVQTLLNDINVRSAILTGVDGEVLVSAALETGETWNDDMVFDIVIEGTNGDDDIYIGKGDSVLFGRDGDDTLSGGIGDDKLYGGKDDDYIKGHSGDDRLRGGTGDDLLKGGSGNDILEGEDGNDTLEGNSGDDTFVFVGNWGDDTITDFDVAGNEILDFSDIAAITSMSDLIIDYGATDTVIEFGDNSITLVATVATLQVDDFIFA